jgi:hypothetical protein
VCSTHVADSVHNVCATEMTITYLPAGHPALNQLQDFQILDVSCFQNSYPLRSLQIPCIWPTWLNVSGGDNKRRSYFAPGNLNSDRQMRPSKTVDRRLKTSPGAAGAAPRVRAPRGSNLGKPVEARPLNPGRPPLIEPSDTYSSYHGSFQASCKTFQIIRIVCQL